MAQRGSQRPAMAIPLSWHCLGPRRYALRSQAFSPCRGSQVGLMVIYPLAVITDVATDVCSSRARLRFASSTRIVVMCRMIEKGTM